MATHIVLKQFASHFVNKFGQHIVANVTIEKIWPARVLKVYG